MELLLNWDEHFFFLFERKWGDGDGAMIDGVECQPLNLDAMGSKPSRVMIVKLKHSQTVWVPCTEPLPCVNRKH